MMMMTTKNEWILLCKREKYILYIYDYYYDDQLSCYRNLQKQKEQVLQIGNRRRRWRREVLLYYCPIYVCCIEVAD